MGHCSCFALQNSRGLKGSGYWGGCLQLANKTLRIKHEILQHKGQECQGFGALRVMVDEEVLEG
jgi:hypothetical protein